MKNKVYSKPIVEAVPVQMSSIVMAGSPGTLQNSGSGTGGIGDPIVIGG